MAALDIPITRSPPLLQRVYKNSRLNFGRESGIRACGGGSLCMYGISARPKFVIYCGRVPFSVLSLFFVENLRW